jgi:hypothetical protein
LLLLNVHVADRHFQVTERNVLDLIEQILRAPTTTEVTREYVLNALVKLTERFRGREIECAFIVSPLLLS